MEAQHIATTTRSADISCSVPLVRYVGGMPKHVRGGARETEPLAATWRSPARWQARWLELTIAAAAAIAAVGCLSHVWPSPLQLVLLLAVPPALAAVGWVSAWRILA